ncbi:MAG: hypothetical protein ACTHJX_07490 [Terriglobales bacterium]
MAECPICGLGERCRNHWVAVQEPNGEVEFQIGPMTASEDNLILLRNKLKNPPLRTLFEKVQLQPEWVEEKGRVLAYLPWPLDLRGAVHRTLFPAGAPGSDARPLAATPIYHHTLTELEFEGVELDLVNSLPDELLYRVRLGLKLEGVGAVPFIYMQVLWADGIAWSRVLPTPEAQQQAADLIRLMLAPLADPLREMFVGRSVDVLSEEQPDGLAAGAAVDELALPGTPERHLGEEMEALIHQRRLQPLLRDSLLQVAGAGADYVRPVLQ